MTNIDMEGHVARDGQPHDLFWTAAVRAHGKCEYCGLDGKKDLHILAGFCLDHIVPRSANGGGGIDNRALCCAPCNHSKLSWNPAEGTDGMLTRDALIERVRLYLGPNPPEWPYYVALQKELREGNHL